MIWDLATATGTTFACMDEMGDVWLRLGSYGGGSLVASRHGDLANFSYVTGLVMFDQDGREVDVPANPYGDCGAEGPGSCDVHGLLPPFGRLLATWYRPDYWLVVPAGSEQQPEWSELYADWTSRLDSLPAEIRVLDHDGAGLFRLEVDARTRLADFDGRFLVVGRRELSEDGLWTDARDVSWTIIDIMGVQAPLTVTGPVALFTDGATP